MDTYANHSAVASDVPGSSSTDSFHWPGLALLATFSMMSFQKGSELCNRYAVVDYCHRTTVCTDIRLIEYIHRS